MVIRGESVTHWPPPMHLFTGEFEHKVDQKGRVFVPKRLLDSIDGNPSELRFVVTLGLDGCLYLFTREGFREHLAGLKKAAFGKPEYRAVMRGIGALSFEQTLDSQGRLLIPEDLRRRVGPEEAASLSARSITSRFGTTRVTAPKPPPKRSPPISTRLCSSWKARPLRTETAGDPFVS